MFLKMDLFLPVVQFSAKNGDTMSDKKNGSRARDAEEIAAIMVDPKTLVPNPKNPRKNDSSVAGVKASISAYGFGDPIVCRVANRMVIAGHTRLKASLELGLEKVPVRFMDITQLKADALMIASNRTGEKAIWDKDLLANILGELKSSGEEIVPTGLTEKEQNQLLTSLLGSPAEERSASEPEKILESWGTVLGDMYRITSKNGGEHRIVCGDSTDPKVFDRLMAGEKAFMCWTDPPYGVSYVGEIGNRTQRFRGPKNEKDEPSIQNDSMNLEELEAFLSSAFACVAANLEDSAHLYIAHPPGPISRTFEDAMASSGVHWDQTLTWKKNTFVMGRSDYHYAHEPIFFAHVGKKRNGRMTKPQRWFGDDGQSSVFEFNKPSASKLHPTMKPVDLVQAMIQNSSPIGGTVLEPFSGSGSTMVACEQSMRLCRAIELDPKFVAVCLQRMSDLGCKVEKIADVKDSEI